MNESAHAISAADVARRVRRGEYSPVELVESFLDRIDDRDDEVNAYVTVTAERALERAREVEHAVESGESVGPLAGVPIAIKDLTFVAGVRNTFGSRAFETFVPDEDAVLVSRLESAGAIVLGKTNTSEFGRKATTDNRLFDATGTPFDPERTAGGSSGGSAAAVADCTATLAQGTDAAGSIRIPASACGVVGVKPTPGRVPETPRPNAFFGRTPYVDAGPIARTVEDAALMLDVMAGPHARDPNCLPAGDADFTPATRRPIDDLSVAYSSDLGIAPVDEQVRERLAATADDLSVAGATVEEVGDIFAQSWETLHDAFDVELQGLYAEMAARFEAECGLEVTGKDRNLFTPEVVARVKDGQELSAAEYLRADDVRTDAFDAVEDVFEEYDVLLTPTLTVPPFDKRNDGPSEVAGEPIEQYHGWLLTWPFNMTGHPAATVPAGFTDDGLPVGAQLIGPRFDEESVFAVSAAVERVAPWYDAYPPER